MVEVHVCLDQVMDLLLSPFKVLEGHNNNFLVKVQVQNEEIYITNKIRVLTRGKLTWGRQIDIDELIVKNKKILTNLLLWIANNVARSSVHICF